MRLSSLFLLLLTSLSANAGEQLFTHQPTVTPSLAQPGNWRVGVKTLKAVNAEQLNTQDFVSKADRSLTLELWYPADVKSDGERILATYEDVTRSGKPFSLQGEAYRDHAMAKAQTRFPLVIISHGYTGYRSQLFYLGEHLASHGYIVASIDHTDSTNADVLKKGDPGSGFVSTLYNRARDQQFVLSWLMKDKGFSSSIAAESAALIGYSMGGYGALNSVGGCYTFSSQTLQSMQFPEALASQLAPVFNSCNAGQTEVDPRWKAMISFAPWGGEQNVHELAGVKVPSMIVAGDHDDVSGYEKGVKSLFNQLGSDNKYMLVYENARHNFAGHPAPKVAYADDFDLGHYYEPSWHPEAMTRVNEHMSLAFLNCYVKEDQKACAYLPTTEHATQVKQKDNTLSPAWPGFPDRWATGLRFIRDK